MSVLGLLGFIKRRAAWHFGNVRGIYEITRRGEGIEIRQGVTIINPERFECGDSMRIESGCFIHCGGNAWSNGAGRIKFGKGCWLAQNNVLYGAGEIEAGDYVGTGPGVMIFSSRDDYSLEHAHKEHIVHQFGKVTIGSYVRIFSGVIVGPGVTIGEGAVVGAGSIVLKDVPPWTIAAGAPARVVGKRERDVPLGERKRHDTAEGANRG